MKKFKSKPVEDHKSMNTNDDEFEYEALIVTPNPNKALQIKTCIPKQPFKIKPGIKSNYVWTVFNKTGWSIVLPALADQGNFIKGMALTTLYPGVMSDGTYFLLPITLSFDRCETSWSMALEKIATVAENSWVVVTKSSTKQKHEYTVVKTHGKPEWPEIQLKDWVKIAFKGKVIKTMEDFEASQNKPTCSHSWIEED